MKGIAATTALLAFLTGCAVRYQPLHDHVGYCAEVLDHQHARVEFHGRAPVSYEKLEQLLRRYAQELCPGQGVPTRIVRDEFIVTTWDGLGSRPPDIRGVSAEIACPRPAGEVLARCAVFR